MATRHPESRLVGQRVAAARRAAKLSQQALADLLGWPRETLINVEHGRRALTIERLIPLAQALQMSPAALLVDMPLAPLVTRIAAAPHLAGQVSFFLDTLDDEIPVRDEG